MEEFKQKRIVTSKKVKFTKEGMIYYSGNFINSREIFIPFDEIMINNITREFITNKILLWLAVGFGLFFSFSCFNVFKFPEETLNIILIISGIICLFFLTLTILSRKHMLYIATLSGYLIDFFDNNPSKELMSKFLQSIKKQSYKYLKEKYTKIDEDIPFEKQLDNFIFLRDKNVITQKEYIALKMKLKNLEPDVKGFRN